MLDELDSLFQQAKVILSDAEQHYRGVYNSALDIDDFTQAQRVSAQAQRSILQIREWKGKLEAFCTEIASSNILAPHVSPAPQTDVSSETDKADTASLGESMACDGVPEVNSPDVAEPLNLPVADAEEGHPEIENSATIEKQPISSDAAGNPRAIKLLGKTYNVSSWNDVYVKVCELMLLHKPYVIAGLDNNAELNPDKSVHFSYIESEIAGNRKRLSNGLWVKTNENQSDCVRLSYGILEKCGYAPETLIVESGED